MRDGVIFALCLGAALCAESIPVALLLAAAALILSFWPRKNRRRPVERVEWGTRRPAVLYIIEGGAGATGRKEKSA